MIRRTLPKRVLTVLALVCLLAAFLSAQVHIREKIQIRPTAPPIVQADVNAGDNLRFVFEWTPDRILGRMFVTGLDNDFNVVVDTFLTDVGGHLEVISPALEGEYSFNLQIRTAELLPGEEETLKLSIYLNETLLREDTDFSYSFTGVFSVWIPESFIFFADPLHHFSLQVNPTPMSYREASNLIVTARDASNGEIPLAGTKTLTLRVVPDDFMSFITTAGDTVGPEMTGVPYSAARAGDIRVIGNGLIPGAFPVSAIVSAELEENTSKTGQLEFDVNIPCVTTNLSSPTARQRDTVAVSFSYTRTNGSPATFRPDQQFSVFIADNDSMGLLYSKDGQVGPDLFGALQPVYYVAPDSLSGDSIVVQFLVEPVVSGGAAAAVPVEGPTMGKSSAGARSNAFQMLALSGCTIASVIVKDVTEEFEILLGESKYYYAVEENGRISIKDDGNPSNPQPRIENIVFSPSKIGEKWATYIDRKYPRFEEGQDGVQLLTGMNGLPAGMIRLVGRFWEESQVHSVKLAAIHSLESGELRSEVVVNVVKPSALLRQGQQPTFRMSKNVMDSAFDLDSVCVRYGGQFGIPPQFIKGQMFVESARKDFGGQIGQGFSPSYRYEPYTTQFKVISMSTSPYFVTGSSMGEPPPPSFHQHVRLIPYVTSQVTVWDFVVAHSQIMNDAPADEQHLIYGKRTPADTTNFGYKAVQQIYSPMLAYFRDPRGGSLGLPEPMSWKLADDSARSYLRKYLQDEWNGGDRNAPAGLANNIAQTRIASSYGLLQLLYTTALKEGYPEPNVDAIPEEVLPENLNVTKTGLDNAVSYQKEILREALGVTEEDIDWTIGYEIAFLVNVYAEWNPGDELYKYRVINASERFKPSK